MDCIHMQETIPTQDAVQTQRPSPEKKTIHVQMTIPINTTKRSGVLKSMVNKCYLKKVCVLVDGSLDAHEQQHSRNYSVKLLLAPCIPPTPPHSMPSPPPPPHLQLACHVVPLQRQQQLTGGCRRSERERPVPHLQQRRRQHLQPAPANHCSLTGTLAVRLTLAVIFL